MGAKRDFSCCILHTPLRDKSDIWNRLGAESSVNWFHKEHISQNWYPKFEQFDWLISKLILLWPNQNTFKFGKLVFYESNEQMILPPRYIRSKKKSKQKKHQQRRSTWRVLNRRITLNFKIIATSFLDDVIMLPWKLQNITDSGYTTKYVVTIFNTSAVQEPRLDTWIYLGRLYPPRFYLPG